MKAKTQKPEKIGKADKAKKPAAGKPKADRNLLEDWIDEKSKHDGRKKVKGA